MIITITLNPALDRTMHIGSPLLVGKLNRATSTGIEPGGKGINVSRAVKALGGESIALGFCAGSNGRLLKDMLTSADIHHDFVDIAGQTRMNTQIIDHTGTHTEINEPGEKLDDANFLRFIDHMKGYLEKDNIFVLTGSCPPEFPMAHYRKLCKTIKGAGCQLIIDAEGEMLLEALKFEPDLVKPNIYELAQAVGDSPSTDPEIIVHSAQKLLEMGAQTVCVSMAQEGALLVSKHEPESLYACTTPKIHDEGSVGTGDAMVGALASALHQKLKFSEIAHIAVAMSRASARLAGTEMATLKKVYEVYEITQVYVL